MWQIVASNYLDKLTRYNSSCYINKIRLYIKAITLDIIRCVLIRQRPCCVYIVSISTWCAIKKTTSILNVYCFGGGA
jgi:hypothetical protein